MANKEQELLKKFKQAIPQLNELQKAHLAGYVECALEKKKGEGCKQDS